MKVWEVKFKFKSCTPSVLVIADNEESAIEKARQRDYPNVPRYIPATVLIVGRGGARPGAGVKKGSKRVKLRRSLIKSIAWTPSEWEKVKNRAEVRGISVSDYQRSKILSGKI